MTMRHVGADRDKRLRDPQHAIAYLQAALNNTDSDAFVKALRTVAVANRISTDPDPEMVIVECGCCGSYHTESFAGDCRDDNQRYAGPDDYAARNGVDENELTIITEEEQLEEEVEE